MAELKEKESVSNDKATEAPAPCQVVFSADSKSGQGSSIHFSERGMLVNCSDPVPVDKKIKLTLQFPGFKNLIELQGEVVWTNIHGPNDALSPRGMGVKFSNVERDTERLLAELASQYEAFGSAYNCFFT